MAHPKYSSELFSQLGGVNWVARESFFSSVQDRSVSQHASDIETKSEDKALKESNVHDEAPLEMPAESQQSSMVEHVESQPSTTSMQAIENPVVIVGSGLDAIWENEEELAWRLWQNIMFAFGWDESQIVFFDTDHLASEEMIFSTIEEVIELDADWVLSMAFDHPISEQLAEGVQVIDVPSLDDMLADPYAKQSFYQTVIGLI